MSHPESESKACVSWQERGHHTVLGSCTERLASLAQKTIVFQLTLQPAYLKMERTSGVGSREAGGEQTAKREVTQSLSFAY